MDSLDQAVLLCRIFLVALLVVQITAISSAGAYHVLSLVQTVAAYLVFILAVFDQPPTRVNGWADPLMKRWMHFPGRWQESNYDIVCAVSFLYSSEFPMKGNTINRAFCLLIHFLTCLCRISLAGLRFNFALVGADSNTPSISALTLRSRICDI